jgi:hypothetical protein
LELRRQRAKNPLATENSGCRYVGSKIQSFILKLIKAMFD